jgi:hypothetical protein
MQPRWRGARAQAKPSTERARRRATGLGVVGARAAEGEHATGLAPNNNALRGGTTRPPPPRRAGARAQARAQAKPSTCEHGAEQEVWGWWAHPEAQRAEDGERRGDASLRAARGQLHGGCEGATWLPDARRGMQGADEKVTGPMVGPTGRE